MSRAKEQRKSAYSVNFLPFEVRIDVPPELTLLEAIKQANLPVKASCGGKGTCGNCAVQILSGTIKRKYSASLPAHLTSQGYILACQTRVSDDLIVHLPQFQELSIKAVADSVFFNTHKDQISGVHEVNSPMKKVDLHIPPPALEDNYSDLKRLDREVKKKTSLNRVDYEYSVLCKLAAALRKNEGKISIVFLQSEKTGAVIDVFPIARTRKIYGLSCDIGTSTVALHLVNLETGEIRSTTSGYNQQIKCGEDIISRINYAQKPGGRDELQDLILGTVNHLITKAVDSVKASQEDIYYAVIAGNTTMIHLLLNLDPRHIREEPYVPTFNRVPILNSRDIGLEINPEGKIFCAPAVGSYVGGDITSGLLSTPILRQKDKISLFIDAGTNGELVIGSKDWLMTCACSAGPAFEGGGIRCGMPASEGAIDSITINEDGNLHHTVIEDSRPRGLCGSGLVDLLAELFVHGYVDRHGKFIGKGFKEKFVKTENGMGFLIETGANSYWGKDIIITEKDITHLVRTKGAVFSACSLLLKNVGLKFSDIDAFYVAGGFGRSLNVENAIRIGLLPDLDREKFHYLGNSSLFGAYLILLSEKNQKIVNRLPELMTYIELNTEPTYMNEYTGALFLPHTDMKLFPSVEKLFRLKNNQKPE